MNECIACGALADKLDEDGYCLECAEHFHCEDMMREEEWHQSLEYESDELDDEDRFDEDAFMKEFVDD